MRLLVTISTIGVLVGVLSVTAFIVPAVTGNAVANLPRTEATMVRPVLLALAILAFVAFNNVFKK